MKIYKDLEQWTPERLDVRKWVITWTKLKWVTGWTKAQLTEMYTLLAETYIEEEPLNAYEIIERGHELEPIAKAKYEDLTWNKVEEVGFITSEDYLGLSPDGIIATEEILIGTTEEWPITSIIYWKAVEIKCPMWKTFIKYLLEDKIPKEYLPQVINYFVVIEDLQELDFAIYHPWASEKIWQLHIITVTRAELQKDIDKANLKIKEFKQKRDTLKQKLLW